MLQAHRNARSVPRRGAAAPLPAGLLVSTALAVCLLSLAQRPAAAVEAPTWQPQASERLVKLPPSYLKKSLDHDFSQSELAAAIQASESEIDMKGQTLADFQTGIEQADGELKVDIF